ncbi:MAG: ketol-acid reductoisomerase [Candidatus Zixiibacteriota bacterium]
MARSRKAKSVAVIGYGSQGRAISRNLRDAGYSVVVGLRPKSHSRSRARKEGLTVTTIPKAVQDASIICFAFPDHLHAGVYGRSIAPLLTPGVTLWFLHGTSVHFGLLKPARGADVILIAPHAPGDAVREAFLADRSLSAFVGVHQNPSGKAAKTALELAQAIGIRRKNLVKTSFSKEAVGDLFGEQAVLCGGLAMLVKSGFETLRKHGWNAENAYLEVAYQLDLIVALIKTHGIAGMLSRISPAAQLGSLGAGPRIIDRGTRKRMERLFQEIQSGGFARKLAKLDNRMLALIRRKLANLTTPELERAARKFSR